MRRQQAFARRAERRTMLEAGRCPLHYPTLNRPPRLDTAMRSHPFNAPLLGICLMISSAARADVEMVDIDVVCDPHANLALVRFPTPYNNDPGQYPRLPQRLDRGLSASGGSNRSDCTMANGTTVRVRGGSEQAFDYGAGGANPPAFFSLWIDRRRVFSRQTWMPGYAQTFADLPTYDGILIEPGRLTICESTEDHRQQCKSRPLNLKALAIDRIEYGASSSKPRAGSIVSIAKGAANQQFCSRYLENLGPDVYSALRGADSTSSLTWSPQDVVVAGNGEGHPKSGIVDLSPGTTRRMMAWGGTNHYFDGDVIVLAPSQMTTQDIGESYTFSDIETWPNIPAPAGVTLISGGLPKLYPDVSPRYVHLVPKRIDGDLYIHAYPTNATVHPTAALVKPVAGGGFFTICAFDQVEAHY